MELKINNIPISTGRILVAVLNKTDAIAAHLHQGDRITITSNRKQVVAIVDITDDDTLVPSGTLGCFTELTTEGKFRNSGTVRIQYAPKPRSIFHIKKKLLGKPLNKNEIDEIISDIALNKLTDIELTYFVSAGYMHEFNDQEITWMTQAMVATGRRIKFNKKIVMDKHCIGGVAANRTTCVVVPIIAAAGLTIPKSSSRSITSPAGTSDTMEVLCNVSLSLDKMINVVKKCNGCLVWGGAINLAPADDKIIKVEHPMSLDPVGQLLTSILAKKLSVGATHVLIDVPFGPGAKISDKSRALMLKKKFETIGGKLGMNVKVVITDGTQPIGNGIGPVLEARDIIWTLQNDTRGSVQLKNKAIELAGIMLEMGGAARKGQGQSMARQLIDNGSAYAAFSKIVRAQGGKEPVAENLKLASYSKVIYSSTTATITHIDNATISAIAKLAGAPQDKQAGVLLHHHVGDTVRADQPLYTIYAVAQEKLDQAVRESAKHSGFTMKTSAKHKK